MANCEWIDVDGSPVRVQRRAGAGPVDADEVRRLVREIRAERANERAAGNHLAGDGSATGASPGGSASH